MQIKYAWLLTKLDNIKFNCHQLIINHYNFWKNKCKVLNWKCILNSVTSGFNWVDLLTSMIGCFNCPNTASHVQSLPSKPSLSGPSLSRFFNYLGLLLWSHFLPTFTLISLILQTLDYLGYKAHDSPQVWIIKVWPYSQLTCYTVRLKLYIKITIEK